MLSARLGGSAVEDSSGSPGSLHSSSSISGSGFTPPAGNACPHKLGMCHAVAAAMRHWLANRVALHGMAMGRVWVEWSVWAPARSSSLRRGEEGDTRTTPRASDPNNQPSVVQDRGHQVPRASRRKKTAKTGSLVHGRVGSQSLVAP